MIDSTFQEITVGGFSGRVRQDLSATFSADKLRGLANEVAQHQTTALAWGRHRVVAIPCSDLPGGGQLAIKAFASQSRWKDRIDFKRGSKAQRSFQAAKFLHQHGVGTPAPVAYFDRWKDRRLLESYYVSELVEELTSFRDRIRTLYQNRSGSRKLVAHLQAIGTALRQMHDAGFCHRDLGSQNIEMSIDAHDNPTGVFFLDLNRGQIRDKLSLAQRAADFARLELPSGFLEILAEIYWAGTPPDKFLKHVWRSRNRFRWWQASRALRHPIQTFGPTKVRLSAGKTADQNVWVWNDYSDQATIALNSPDRRPHRSKLNHLKIAGSVVKRSYGIKSTAKQLIASAFQRPVNMRNRIGISLTSAGLDIGRQWEFLEPLGQLPTLVRISHHDQPESIHQTLASIDFLHERGHDILLAVLQDRRAVLNPESWQNFLGQILTRVAEKVSTVEIGHAINRMKWGVHTLNELNALLTPVADLQQQFPSIQFSGPACIDFEYHYVIAALDHAPKNLHFDALSHHLYVDRRGAPENQQLGCSVVEKAAWLKAIAARSNRCKDQVIISEVNWPLESTGIYSPVRRTHSMTRDQGSRVEVSPHDYGCYMIRYLALVLSSGFIDRVYWWQLVSHGYGLIDDRSANSWQPRVGYHMLVTFVQQLGEATFVEKLPTPTGVYALKFQRQSDCVTLVWSTDKAYSGPWPIEFSRALDATGNPISLTAVDGSPCYLISAR